MTDDTLSQVRDIIPADAAAMPGDFLAGMFRAGGRSDGITRRQPDGSAGELLTVLGVEDRVWVRQTGQPWANMICQITGRSGSGDESFGTGFLVGGRTVVTAAHVLHRMTDHGVFRAVSVQVVPGRDLDDRPYGAYADEAITIHPDWFPTQAVGTDIAVIRLTAAVTPQMGASTPGRFGLADLTDAGLRDRIVNIAGYPGSVGVGANLIPPAERFTRHYLHANRIPAAGVQADHLLHQIDTDEGQSGAPLVLMPIASDPFIGPTVVGIHTRGVGNGTPRDNTATRLTGKLVQFVRAQLALD